MCESGHDSTSEMSGREIEIQPNVASGRLPKYLYGRNGFKRSMHEPTRSVRTS